MKKFVSMALAICLLLTALVVPASALTAADFTDIPDNWAKAAIAYCLENGLMNGVGSGKFDPNGKVTRAQIAQVLYNREGSPSTEGLANPFTDADGWFYNAVIWCKNNGVVNGNSATTFNPMGPVTRQDICVMVYRYVKDYKKQAVELTEENKMSSTFTDWGKVAGYAKEAIRWANKTGFMKGTSGTTLDPTGQATRAQLAQFLMNLDAILTEEPEPEKCEHGNDPETCPICHPKEPEYTGSYNPNPDPDSLYLNNSAIPSDPSYIFAATKAYEDAMDPNDTRYAHLTREEDQNFFKNGILPNGGTAPELYLVPGALKGLSYKGYVPYKGYVVGGDTYEITLGNQTYTRATGGRIYNRFGVDVTDVDGVTTDLEYHMAQYFISLMGGKSGSSIDPALQMAAEAALAEAKENMDNLSKAGLPSHLGTADGMYAVAGKVRVPYTRWAVEQSKTTNMDTMLMMDKLSIGANSGLVGVDDELMFDVNNLRTDSYDLAAGALVSYFGPSIFFESYDRYHNPNTPVSDVSIHSYTARLDPSKDNYSTLVQLCQASTAFRGRLTNSNLHIGLAYDEEVGQIFIVALNANDGSYDSYATSLPLFYAEGCN